MATSKLKLNFIIWGKSITLRDITCTGGNISTLVGGGVEATLAELANWPTCNLLAVVSEGESAVPGGAGLRQMERHRQLSRHQKRGCRHLSLISSLRSPF